MYASEMSTNENVSACLLLSFYSILMPHPFGPPLLLFLSRVVSGVLRTPDSCFETLPGFDYEPNYVDDLPGYEGLRMAYIDEGPTTDASTTNTVSLCLHGQPTWSYLYRNMLPVFSDAGHRVVAPDLFGFGRSDKPVDEATYTYDFHHGALMALIERLNLQNVNLVVQDWGGLLGLSLPHTMPERFESLVVMNTAFAAGDLPLGKGFLDWRDFANSRPDLEVAKLMKRSCPEISSEVAQAYGAPWPSTEYKAGVRRFPNLVPDHPDAGGAALSRQARAWFESEWNGKTFMAVGAADPVLGLKPMAYLQSVIRGCPEPLILEGVGHFVQETGGKQVAEAALAAFDA